jgi:hypothetical protein
MSSTNKMQNKTVKELQAIAKAQGLRGYSKLRKADLIARLETSEEVKPKATIAKPVKPVALVGFDAWAEEQLAKPIKQAVSTTYDWIMDKVPQPVKNVIDAGFYKLKNEITKLFNKSESQKLKKVKQQSTDLQSNT